MIRISMCRAAGLVGLFVLTAVPAAAQQPLEAVYAHTDSLLQAHVVDGQVDYGALADRPEALHRLVARLEQQDLAALSDAEAKAFLLNAYNLLVIDAVVAAYPIASPQAVPGFFEQSRYDVAGETRSLNEVEALLFEQYPDPRLHFALVCAAQSCPVLPDSTYRPDRLDAQLDRITRQTIRSDRFVERKDRTETVRFSKIFDWYTDDFTREAGSLIEYVNPYRAEPIPSTYDVTFRAYDWTLNEYKAAEPSSQSSESGEG